MQTDPFCCHSPSGVHGVMIRAGGWHPRAMGWTVLLVLAGLSPAGAQVVTVSAVPASAMETSIQTAIASLAPGGSRDDGDPLNNTVQIIDSAIYSEALSINALGLVLEGTGASRPTIITTVAQAAVNAGGSAIRIDSDRAVTLRNLIILPDAAAPPIAALTVDEFTATGGYTLTVEDVLIAGNDGSNLPCSVTGRTAPPAGTVTYTSHVLDMNSPGAAGAPLVTLRRLVMTGATTTDRDLIRIFTDNGTVRFEEGCVLSFSGGDAVSTSVADNTIVRWLGTLAEPIIIHGNAMSAITNAGALTRTTAEMTHVAITRNSTGADESAVLDACTSATPSTWDNVTIAGNSTRDSGSGTTAVINVSCPVQARNCILAGDAMETQRGTGNLLRVTGVNGSLTIDGSCVDISRGGTSLNATGDAALGGALDGVVGGSLIQTGAGASFEGPRFYSLDPASADYLVASNMALAGRGPSGADLVGAGSLRALDFVGVRTNSGNLKTYLEGVAIPGETSTDKYRQPTADEQMLFRDVIDDIAAGRFQSASNRAALVNYDLIIHEDTAQSNRRYAVLEERATNRSWGGIFAVDLDPRRQLVVESPHPLFDGTRLQGIDLFIRLNALAFMQAGTHRNNSPVESPCDGTQTNGDPYYISDMAHNADSFFQMAHEQIFRRYANALSVSVHGMAASSDPSDVVISNGALDDEPPTSLSRMIASTMNSILTAASDSRYAVSHQEPGEFPALSGSTNTQGRFTNGSHNPCGASIQALQPERFIHMEQSPTVRSGSNPTLWQFVSDTYTTLIPNYSAWVQPFQEDGSEIMHLPLDANLNPSVGDVVGTATGATSGQNDRFSLTNAAFGFANGANARITDFPYDGPDREFSYVFWFKTTPGTGTFQYLLSHGGIGRNAEVTIPNTMHVYLETATGQLRVRFTLQDGERWNFNGPSGLWNGAWHFFVLTYSDTAGTTVYVDGASVGNNATHRGMPFEPEGPMYFGARSDLSPDHFLAPGATVSTMDDVIFYNSVLTQQQITDLYEAQNNPGVDSWNVF